MNVVPENAVRVMPEDMKEFIRNLYTKTGMTEDRTELIADLLVGHDLRGIFSHGTRQSVGYVRTLLEGNLNPNPDVKVIQDQPAIAVVDGDGGLGHFASWKAAHLVVEKASEAGLGAVTTRNHHHFGGAGKYSRVASEAGYVGFVVSSHLRGMGKGQIMNAGGASPMSFAIPNGEEPPLVLDMATSIARFHSVGFEELYHQAPSMFFKSLGLGAVCHALGGVLAGIVTLSEEKSEWSAVNQGAFFMAIDVSRFADPGLFRSQMDGFVRDVHELEPFPGEARAMLPGQLEWERERDWTRDGIPIGEAHQKALAELAEEIGVTTPF